MTTGKRTGLIMVAGFVICLFAWPGSARAKVYRYVDEEGTIHYTSYPVTRQNTKSKVLSKMELRAKKIEEAEKALEEKYGRYRKVAEDYEIVDIVFHSGEPVLCIIRNRKTGVEEQYIVGNHLEGMELEEIQKDRVIFTKYLEDEKIIARLFFKKAKEETFADTDEDAQIDEKKKVQMILSSLEDEVKNFEIINLQEGQVQLKGKGEVELTEEKVLAKEQKFRSELEQYKGKFKNSPKFQQIEEKIIDLFTKSVERFQNHSGLVVPEKMKFVFKAADTLKKNEIYKTEIKDDVVDVVFNPEPLVTRNEDMETIFRNLLVDLLLAGNEKFSQAPDWLKNVIEKWVREQDYSDETARCFVSIYLTPDIWEKKFDSIIRPFEELGKDQFYKDCDILQVNLFIDFINSRCSEDEFKDFLATVISGANFKPKFCKILKVKNWTSCYNTFRDEAYRSFMKLSTEDKKVSFYLGKRYYENSDYESSIKKFQDIINKDPDYAPAHYYLGLNYLKLNNYEKALAAVGKAVELDGTKVEYSETMKSIEFLKKKK